MPIEFWKYRTAKDFEKIKHNSFRLPLGDPDPLFKAAVLILDKCCDDTDGHECGRCAFLQDCRQALDQLAPYQNQQITPGGLAMFLRRLTVLVEKKAGNGSS